MTDAPDLISLYSKRILALAASVPRLGRLESPQASGVTVAAGSSTPAARSWSWMRWLRSSTSAFVATSPELAFVAPSPELAFVA